MADQDRPEAAPKKLFLRDNDTGESVLEAYPVPEGLCLVMSCVGSEEFFSIILDDDSVKQLAEVLADATKVSR